MASFALAASGLQARSAAALAGRPVKTAPRAFAVKPAQALCVKAQRSEDVKKALGAAAVAPVVLPAAANASELGQDLKSAVDTIDGVFDKAEQVYSSASAVAGKAVEVAKGAAPIVERVGKAAAPVVDAVGKVTARTVVPAAEEALKLGAGAASSAVSTADEVLKSQGVDVAPVAGAAAKAVSTGTTVAKPVVTAAVDFLTNATPTQIVELGLEAGAVYLLLPLVLGAAGSAVRGYSGEVRPVEVYDGITSGENFIIVDVRREGEAARGSVKLPRGGNKKVLSVQRERLSGGFKTSPAEVEAKLTALKLASLKGIKKSAKVVLMDASGGDAPAIAKELAGQGFGKVFVMKGGFAGWTNAGLATAKSNVVKGEVLPFSPFSGPSGAGGTGKVIDVAPSRGFLPPPRS